MGHTAVLRSLGPVLLEGHTKGGYLAQEMTAACCCWEEGCKESRSTHGEREDGDHTRVVFMVSCIRKHWPHYQSLYIPNHGGEREAPLPPYVPTPKSLLLLLLLPSLLTQTPTQSPEAEQAPPRLSWRTKDCPQLPTQKHEPRVPPGPKCKFCHGYWAKQGRSSCDTEEKVGGST